MPDEKTKRRIFNIHTARMTLAEDVNVDEHVQAKDDLSGADIKVGDGVCSRVQWGTRYPHLSALIT